MCHKIFVPESYFFDGDAGRSPAGALVKSFPSMAGVPSDGKLKRIFFWQGREYYLTGRMGSGKDGYCRFWAYRLIESTEWDGGETCIVAERERARTTPMKALVLTGCRVEYNKKAYVLGEQVEFWPIPDIHLEKKKPQKLGYIFGWRYGGDSFDLYVQRREKNTPEEDVPPGYSKCSWWVTHNPGKATHFKSLSDCIDYWRKIHWQPEETEMHIYDGFLQFFAVGPTGTHRVPGPTRQLALF